MKIELDNISTFLYLNGNKSQQGYFAIGSQKEITVENGEPFESLNQFLLENEGWKFGFLTYDLKNDIERLSSGNYDGIKFPKLTFFIPENLFEVVENKISTIYGDENLIPVIEDFLQSKEKQNEVKLNSRISKQDYLSSVNSIKDHIQKGDCYELNFCYEYFNDNAEINPFITYNHLNSITQAPFSCFGKFNDKYILSASPERFIRKEGNKVISQPIKGTAPRGKSSEEDLQLKSELEQNPKERSENIMIVDLVRNDFSKFAAKNSVKVDELCKIYSFETVHQMISTISCETKEGTTFTDIIKATFPMGSMTGAPKIRAMELIEQYESTKRGVYSGAIGYIKPNGDFDFNVIIRTLLYNQSNKYLSCMVGSAITIKSDPEKEYEETLWKAEAILKSLQ